jgi:hypothetical protein
VNIFTLFLLAWFGAGAAGIVVFLVRCSWAVAKWREIIKTERGPGPFAWEDLQVAGLFALVALMLLAWGPITLAVAAAAPTGTPAP